MTTIVISYRRDDTGVICGRLYDRLEAHFGRNSIFMDIDAIPPGRDFREHITTILDRCDIVLAVIGPNWLGHTADGDPRLADETDWVRLEIETALAKKLPVIPVLIDRTPMPKPSQLPASLRDLAFRNAAMLDTGIDFRPHSDRLIRALDDYVGVTGYGGAERPIEARVHGDPAQPFKVAYGELPGPFFDPHGFLRLRAPRLVNLVLDLFRGRTHASLIFLAALGGAASLMADTLFVSFEQGPRPTVVLFSIAGTVVLLWFLSTWIWNRVLSGSKRQLLFDWRLGLVAFWVGLAISFNMIHTLNPFSASSPLPLFEYLTFVPLLMAAVGTVQFIVFGTIQLVRSLLVALRRDHN